MKKKNILMLILVAGATVLSAQVTREKADEIVKKYLQDENYNHLYVNSPSEEGIIITTSNGETFRAKYACWAYYLNESELFQCRYFFVKADNGNLLEVIASNDAGLDDLTQWEAVDGDSVYVKQLRITNYELRIYPNPVNDVLTIECRNGASEAESVEIYDVIGRLSPPYSPSRGEHPPLKGAGGCQRF